MRICNNIANVIRAYKELSRKSYADCAKELGISCSALKDYAAGRRSPRMDTLEHFSQKLGADPSKHNKVYHLIVLVNSFSFFTETL